MSYLIQNIYNIILDVYKRPGFTIFIGRLLSYSVFNTC